MATEETPNLDLPYIMAAQAQKHVSHNEAIRALDAIVQLSVKNQASAPPSATPENGTRYLIGTAATGAWVGKEGKLVAFQDGAWAFYQPREGWLCWVTDDSKLLVYEGSSWRAVSEEAGAINPAPFVGVNTTADPTNRLSVISPNSLFSHDGSDHRIKINKATEADTASFVFQTGFLGHAEIGLSGNDDLHVKVSADGSNWFEAIIIDKITGHLSLPNTPQREVLGTNRTYYVRTDGNDANDGLTNNLNGAFVTIQKAVDEALTLDANSFGVEIQVAAGTYLERVIMPCSVIGADRLLIQGDTSTPSNVIVGKDGFDCFRFTGGANVEIRGFKCVQAGSWGNGVYLSGGSDVNLGAMDFGNTPRFHIQAESGAAVQVVSDYTISGGASRHINLSTNSILTSVNRTVTVTGTPAFGSFIRVASGATVSMWNPAFNGSATGQRFNVSLNGVLNTSGKPIDLFPGDAAGATLTGGQYG